jgi:hypothetical protein
MHCDCTIFMVSCTWYNGIPCTSTGCDWLKKILSRDKLFKVYLSNLRINLITNTTLIYVYTSIHMSDFPPMTPQTPASSSTDPSAISECSSQPQGVKKPIWVFFRTAEGNEAVWHKSQLTRGRRQRHRIHYCVPCEAQGLEKPSSNAFSHNAKGHIQHQHPDEWLR